MQSFGVGHSGALFFEKNCKNLYNPLKDMARRKGSAKTGGRGKGTKNKKTVQEIIQKEKENEYIQHRIRKELGPIIDALISLCKKKNLAAIIEALNRLIGKPKEALDITSQGERIYGWDKYATNNNILPKRVDKGVPRRKSEMEGDSSTP